MAILPQGYQFQLLPELAPNEYEALKADIAQNGVMIPVEVDENGATLDGHHRIRAWTELAQAGVKLPPYPTIVRRFHNDDEKVEHALKANLMRRHLDREQLKDVAKELRLRGEYWTLEKIGETLGVSHMTVKRWTPVSELTDVKSGEVPTVINSRGQERPIAYKPRASASAVAMNPRETERALLALESFDENEPDDAGDDEFVNTSTGELVTTSQLRQKAAQREREHRNAELAKNSNAPMPNGKFRCIVLDPPWPVQKIERDKFPDQGKSLDYPVMSLEDIFALPVGDVADDDAHIYLWVTQKYLPAGMEMLKAWGFNYQCLMTWVKPSGFTPYSWMYNTEHVIFGRRGSLDLMRMGLKLSFDAPNPKHSAKPDVFYERVIAASPGPRLEMFARQPRDGFTVWGNEAGEAEDGVA